MHLLFLLGMVEHKYRHIRQSGRFFSSVASYVQIYSIKLFATRNLERQCHKIHLILPSVRSYISILIPSSDFRHALRQGKVRMEDTKDVVRAFFETPSEINSRNRLQIPCNHLIWIGLWLSLLMSGTHYKLQASERSMVWCLSSNGKDSVSGKFESTSFEFYFDFGQAVMN
jgi:hypothetical protein